MLNGPNSLSSTLATIYNTNNNAIIESLARIASGKRIQTPSDDFAGYAKASTLNSDIELYKQTKYDIQDAKGLVDYAVEVGNSIVSDFDRMLELRNLYEAANGDAVKQSSYKAEYDATVLRIADLKGDAYYDDVQVYKSGVTLTSVSINPENSSLVLDVEATKTGDESRGNVDDITNATETEIQNEINNAATYLAQMQSFSKSLQQYLNLADTAINSKQAAVSSIIDIDEMEEMSNLTALQIRQGATAAMLAQANVIQGYAARLYGGASQ